MKNIPYVSQKNPETGLPIPLKENYINEFPNRRERRRYLNEPPLHGPSKNYHLTVLPNGKFKRVMQHETDKQGNKKLIIHYLACN